jgi:menaquinone-dependent protoporphyrinogen IX oxidase
MKGIIIFQGKYGSTRQYAQWLSDELKYPAREPAEISSSYLTNCDVIVIGSAVYMGKLLIRKWLKRHTNMLKNKKLFFFIVCATPPAQRDKLDAIVMRNMPLSILNQTKTHFLQGKMNIKGLTWLDRFLLKMGARLEKDPDIKREMLTDFNAVKKENIDALVKDVKAFYLNKEVSV